MINTDSKIPLYYQLAETIQEQIDSGKYKNGEKIPSERELCTVYDVSRITVRLAIDELERHGKLEKIQGKGTYVRTRSITQNLTNVYSFSKEMERQGKISSTRVIKKEIIQADEKLAEKLEVKPGTKAIYLERLRCTEDVAIMVEKTWFPYKGFEFLMDINFDKMGLYRTLENEYGILINRAVETFNATELTPRECKLLSCPKKQFGLLVRRTSYSNDRLVSYSAIVSKGDTFEFTVKLNS